MNISEIRRKEKEAKTSRDWREIEAFWHKIGKVHEAHPCKLIAEAIETGNRWRKEKLLEKPDSPCINCLCEVTPVDSPPFSQCEKCMVEEAGAGKLEVKKS